MAASTSTPPAITSRRGAKKFTSCEDTPRPIPRAMTNGMNPMPARSAL